MKRIFISVIVTFAVLITANQMAFSQVTVAPVSNKDTKRVEKVKRDLSDIGRGNTITVSRIDNRDFFGRVKDIGDDDFEITETDTNRVQIFKYVDIKNVRKGDGQTGYRSGRRNHRSRPYVIAGLVGGLILGLLLAARELGKD